MSYFRLITNDLIKLVIEKLYDTYSIFNFSSILKDCGVPGNELFKDVVRRRLSSIFGSIDEKLLNPSYEYDSIYTNICSNEGFNYIASFFFSRKDLDAAIRKNIGEHLGDVFDSAEELFIILTSILDNLISQDYFILAMNDDVGKVDDIPDMKLIYMDKLNKVENTDEVFEDVIDSWIWYYAASGKKRTEDIFIDVLTLMINRIGIPKFKISAKKATSERLRTFDEICKFFNMKFIRQLYGT